MIIAKIKDGINFIKRVKSSNRKAWQEVIYNISNLFGYDVKFSAGYSPDGPDRTILEFYKNEKNRRK